MNYFEIVYLIILFTFKRPNLFITDKKILYYLNAFLTCQLLLSMLLLNCIRRGLFQVRVFWYILLKQR